MTGEIYLGLLAGIIIGYFVCFVIYVGFGRNTTMTIYYPDGTWVKGIRKSKYIPQETRGTHHYLVIDANNEELKKLIGKRIAVPINSVKYFVLEGMK
jgi:hypothetical protein